MADIVLRDRSGNPLDYSGINKLKVKRADGETQSFFAVSEVETTVDPNFSAGDIEVTPGAGELFSKVTVLKPENLRPEIIAKDEVVAGITGTLESGTREPEDDEFHVCVFDYDGTILAEQYLKAGDVFTLPDPPTHDRFVFDGWSSSADITDNTVTVEDNDIYIGSMFHPASGATEFDIFLVDSSKLTLTFNDVLTGMTSIDWGDGTVDSNLTHTYSACGSYTIKVYGVTAIATSSTTKALWFGTAYASVYAVYFAKNITSLGDYALYNRATVLYVTLPADLETLGTYAFNTSSSLKHITLPPGVTELPQSACVSCGALRSIVIPKSVTAVYNSLQSCFSLRYLCLPKDALFKQNYSISGAKVERIIMPSIAGLVAPTMTGMHALRRIVFRDGLTSIPNNAIAGSLIEVYDFSALTSVPTLESVTSFTVWPATKILVPAALYEEWKAATYWSTYADNIVAV